MNLRKAIFVFGGGGLIILILAYRFGLLAKVKKAAQPIWDKQVKVRMADSGPRKTPPPARPEVKAAVKAAPAAKAEAKAAPAVKAEVKPAPAAKAEVKAVSAAPALIRTVPAAVKTKAEPAAVAPKAAVAEKAVPKVAGKEISGKRATEKELNPLGLGDPFAYAANGAGNYTPLAGGKSVGGIAVKGIICLAGQEPLAILSLKEKDRVYYVKKGDVIRVNTTAKKGAVRSEAYIVVKDVRNDEVELIQQERPDKVIIIR